MTRVFTWEFDVRTYELDANGHVNNAVYHNYLEEGATRASADCGFSYEWYFEHNRAWVVRKMLIRYLQPLRMGDRARLHTWVSDFHRIQSHREYDLRRASDDTPVVRARANWVYVDLETMRPVRIPLEFKDAFDPAGMPDDDPLDVRLKNPTVFNGNPVYVSRRRVQRYELDPAGVVNNSVYLRWFEQAMYDALASIGWPVERMTEIGLGMVQAAHEIDYKRPALDRMDITITSRPVELSRVRGAWEHVICDAATGDVLAEDYSVGAFLDLKTGKPTSLPEPLHEAVLAGPPA